MRFLLELAWRDLRSSGRSLWIFFACLTLGVTLVAAGGGLYRQVSDALLDDARLLFGGDVEVESRTPLSADALDWMRERGTLSRVVELRTMLVTQDGRSQLVELQSADRHYPLYGTIALEPPGELGATLEERAGTWGAALDPALAARLGLGVGDRVEIGDAQLEVRALVLHQPDRSLRANWRGLPVMVAAGGLEATGLVRPGSRVEYQYRIRTATGPAPWRDAFMNAFPRLDAQVRTFEDRSARMAEVLGQIGSGLLLIGFSALFIGGLGVFNSVHAYLQGKLASLATLRAIGLRDRRLAVMVLLQVVMLAVLASAVGIGIGAALAVAGAGVVAERLPLVPLLGSLAAPLAVALAFGVLTAVVFALPALGRALSVTPAVLFRGPEAASLRTPRGTRALTAAAGALVCGLLLVALPDHRLGLAFVGAAALLLLLLEAITRGLRAAAGAAVASRRWELPVALRLALAGMQERTSPLRPALVSLGAALALLVACTLVVAALLRALDETIPQNAPALVLYDVQPDQRDAVREALGAQPSFASLRLAPLVLGRLTTVNGEALADSGASERAREARDEHKLSDAGGNIDDVVVERGAWWPAGYAGPPKVAMEDREADQLGLRVGDRLRFEIAGSAVEAELAAIYAQRRLQARLWLEGIFSDGVLDPHVTRYVGAAWLEPADALRAQDRIASIAPNVVSVRTDALLAESRALLSRAALGLGVVAAVCLAASLLVLASVVAATRTRRLYDATVMHVLGARLSALRNVLVWEYAVLAAVTAAFAALAGSALATGLLSWRIDLEVAGLYWTGVLAAVATSVLSLGLGARYLLARMRLDPGLLLRSGG